MDQLDFYLIQIQEWKETATDQSLLDAFKKMANALSRHYLGVSAGKALKGAAAITAMVAISYKFYKDHMSKAAKACKGKRGVEKKECMKKGVKKQSGTQNSARKQKRHAKRCEKTKQQAKRAWQGRPNRHHVLTKSI